VEYLNLFEIRAGNNGIHGSTILVKMFLFREDVVNALACPLAPFRAFLPLLTDLFMLAGIDIFEN